MEFWYSKSRQFHLLWFSFLGGMMVLGFSFHSARDFVGQVSSQLSKYGAEAFTIDLAQVALVRESIPVGLGLILAFLSPLLSICAYYMIRRSELSTLDQRNILSRSHIKAIMVITPILLFGALATALITVYCESVYKKFYILFNIYDLTHAIFKVLLLELVLLGLVFLEIKILYKIKGLLKLIAVCFLSIHINTYAIIAVDYGIVHLVTPR